MLLLLVCLFALHVSNKVASLEVLDHQFSQTETLSPMESAIMGLSGLGVSFIPSTMALMGLSVLLAISEGFTSHLCLRLLALAGYKLPFTLTRWMPFPCTPFPLTPVPFRLLALTVVLPWTPFPFI